MLDREAWEELGELYLEVSPVLVTCLHMQMLCTRRAILQVAILQVALTCNHMPQFCDCSNTADIQQCILL